MKEVFQIKNKKNEGGVSKYLQVRITQYSTNTCLGPPNRTSRKKKKKKQARQDPRYVADSNTISKTVNNGRNPQLIKSTSYISSRPDTAISHPISEQNIERERERDNKRQKRRKREIDTPHL